MNNFSPKKKSLILILLVILAASLFAGCSKKEKTISEQSFPKEYRGMTQQQFITGPAAIADISKLHGTDIAIKEGYQAMYQSSEKQLILWISVSNNKEDAVKLLAAMNSKIGGSKAFTNFKEETIDSQKVYYVYGMNMDNYFYQIDNKVYWAAIGAQDTKAELQAILKDF